MKTIKSITASLALLSGLLGANIIHPEASKAAECQASGSITGANFVTRYGTGAPGDPDGTESGEGMCYGTPSTYEISIYEMGVCTSAPITSSSSTVAADATSGFATTDFDSVDTSVCTTTTSGTWTGDLGGSASFDMGTGSKPAAGTYTHAYIILGNTFGLKGSYELTDGGGTTYYSNGDASGSTNVDSTTGTATPVAFTETLTSFGGGSCVHVGREQFTTGTPGWLSAVVTDSTATTPAVATTCNSGSINRIVGMFEPDTPITISESTTGLKVTFTVTSSGMSVIGDGSGAIDQLGSGPFRTKFDIIE